MTVVQPVDPIDPAGSTRPDDSRLRALGIDPSMPEPAPSPAQEGEPIPSHESLSASGGDASAADSEVGPVDTPIWLSHHWPDDYDRCAVVGGFHVCRRCLVLYPLALVAGVAVSLGSWWDHAVDPWILWLFPLPGVVEFVLDNLRVIAYRPLRQMILSAGGAVAAGIGYVRYLEDTTDTLAWTVLAVYTAATLSAAIVGGLLRRRAGASISPGSPGGELT